MNRKLKVYIMCGASCSGKSTKAKWLQKETNAIICSADHYFYDVFGKYNFDLDKLALAHKICYDKADKYLEDGFNVIIDNTNTNSKDRNKYEKLAQKHDAEVVFVEPEASWRYNLEELVKRNEKGVPTETIEKQLKGAIEFWKLKQHKEEN